MVLFFSCEKPEKGYLVNIYIIISVMIYFQIKKKKQFFAVKIPEMVDIWLCVAFWKTINVYD